MTTEKPSKNEDEFFLLQDQELMKAQRAKLDAERAAAKRREHYMKCPKCGADLQEQSAGPVKTDVCPECHGMWLDAGEFEMLTNVREGAVGGFLKDILKGLRNK
jgi:uncharacterized protein with PIN domain